MTDDATVFVVQRHLDAIWPDEMRRETASGLQWGQLIAHAAVAALRVNDLLKPDSEPREPFWESLRDADPREAL